MRTPRQMQWPGDILDAAANNLELKTCIRRDELAQFLREATGQEFTIPEPAWPRRPVIKAVTPSGVRIVAKCLGDVIYIDVLPNRRKQRQARKAEHVPSPQQLEGSPNGAD